MAGKLSFMQSTEQQGLGVASVEFTDATGAVITTFSNRIDTDTIT